MRGGSLCCGKRSRLDLVSRRLGATGRKPALNASGNDLDLASRRESLGQGNVRDRRPEPNAMAIRAFEMADEFSLNGDHQGFPVAEYRALDEIGIQSER